MRQSWFALSTLPPLPLLDGMSIMIIIMAIFIVIINVIIAMIIIMTNRYASGFEVLESERVKVHHRGGRHALTIKQVNMIYDDDDSDDDDNDDEKNDDDDDETQSVVLSNCQSQVGTR